MMSTDPGYEVIEVPVPKVEVKVILDDVLDALSRHASASANDTQQAQPQLSAQLDRLSQLASQLKGWIGQEFHSALVGQPNPSGSPA